MARLSGIHDKSGGAPSSAKLRKHTLEDDDRMSDDSMEDSDLGSYSEDEEDDPAATEHYLDVGESKIRSKDAPILGSHYRGKKISRAALDDSTDEAVDESEDEDSLQAGSESDVVDEEDDSAELSSQGSKNGATILDGSELTMKNRRKKRPIAADFFSSSKQYDNKTDMEVQDDSDGDSLLNGLGDDTSDDEMLDDDEDEEEEEGEDDDGEFGSSDDDEFDSESGEDGDDSADEKTSDLRASLKDLMKESANTEATLAKPSSETEKDKAAGLRSQRQTYDSLLNVRIRLQKGLVAVNTFEVANHTNLPESQLFEAAETAALNLWNSINSLRAQVEAKGATTSPKRPRQVNAASSSQDIWDGMMAAEEQAVKKRRKIMDQWSNKVKASTPAISKRQLNPAAAQTLTDVLETQLVTNTGMVERTMTPRSCAPVQAANKVAKDTSIYDDADFYQLLLKQLIDQRNGDASTVNAGATGPTASWAAIKEAKTRKQVDRKASKGRKLRFTVHEKLQNFMAPENRCSWEIDAIDRLFGTLFGQQLQLSKQAVANQSSTATETTGADFPLFSA